MTLNVLQTTFRGSLSIKKKNTTVDMFPLPGSCKSTAEPSWLSFTFGSSIRKYLRFLRLPLRELTLGEQVHSTARGTATYLQTDTHRG